MSRAMMYRRSLTNRASFHAKNAFSGVSTGKALASRRGGNGVVNRARTATLYASRVDDGPKQVIRAKFRGHREAMSGWSPTVAPTTVSEGL